MPRSDAVARAQARYLARSRLVKATLHPEKDAEAIRALERLVEQHGSMADAVRAALLATAKG